MLNQLNGKISASPFDGQLYCDTTTNLALVVTRKIDATLETEHSRQSDSKTASERVQAPHEEQI